MYIIEKYWGNYIGSTDDSLTLLEYLMEKKAEISLSEIFTDIGLDKLNWNFRKTEPALGYTTPDGWEYPFYYAIDVVTDLAALMLECKINGDVSLMQLFYEKEGSVVCISSTQEEKAAIIKCLRLEGSNFRLGGIAPITRAVPSFRVPMRLAVSVAWQKGN